MEANIYMNSFKTAHMEQSDLGPYCLQLISYQRMSAEEKADHICREWREKN